MKIIAIAASLLVLAACSKSEPESVENRARTLEAELENRADALEAEAENGVNAAAMELEQDFPAFTNESGNAAENGAAGE
ncbi:hypothetical protein IC614_10700 [Allosphingosinicella flava]|uniref:Uncharacterized protein n=1 Tax=Allosphingosinicella flava TaxID=2771430 RepID=A0A7T2GJ23_9SPHN|nr:hypothetical protein [Sphingosinicella flava]QPQ54780.1 hypothetical protein IC614_10700 [Sphingosinicella flava]